MINIDVPRRLDWDPPIRNESRADGRSDPNVVSSLVDCADLALPSDSVDEKHRPPVVVPKGLDDFAPVDAARLVYPKQPSPAAMTESVPRGQTVQCTIRDAEVKGEIRGFDYKGRPVITSDAGEKRIGTWEALKVTGDKVELHSPLSSLSARSVIRPPEKLAAALDLALDTKVAGSHVAREYVDALHAGGFAAYITGGAIRDAIHMFATKPEATVEEIAGVLRDVDIVSTAPPPFVRDMAKRIAPEYEEGAVWSPGIVDQYGAVLIGGPKAGLPNPEGLDINSMRSDGMFEDQVKHSDTNKKAYPYVFDHSLLEDAKSRDFACNALYFDPLNRVLIDPTGYGVEDAKAKRLRISRIQDLENDDNIALRFWKFRLRGFEGEASTRALIKEMAPKQLWNNPQWKVVANLTRIMPKTTRTAEDVKAYFDRLRSVMEEDDCSKLFEKRILPQLEKVTEKILKRFGGDS